MQEWISFVDKIALATALKETPNKEGGNRLMYIANNIIKI